MLQLLGPLAGTAGEATWDATTPIFVTAITPMKTGKGLIELEFIRLIAPLRPTSTRLAVKVLHRGVDTIIGSGRDWHGRPVLFAISRIDFDLLRRCCPRLVDRYDQIAYYLLDNADNPNARTYLDNLFGGTAETITAEWTPENYWLPLRCLPLKHGTFPFRHRYDGLDVWLVLRPFVACNMDQKWVIFSTTTPAGESVLRFHRSWTGFLVFEVPFRVEEGAIEMQNARVNLDEREYGFGAPDNEAANLNWIISELLLARSGEMPNLANSGGGMRAKKAWAAHFATQGRLVPDWLIAADASPPVNRRGQPDASA